MVYFFTIEKQRSTIVFLSLIFSSASFVWADDHSDNNHAMRPAAIECRAPSVVDSDILVNLALQCSASQQAEVSRWNAQKHSSQVAGRLDDPKLMTGVAPETFDNDQFDSGFVVELSQTLPWPGRLSLDRKAALAQAEAWHERINLGEVSLAFQVRQHFAQWQYHQRLFELNQAHQQLWQEFIGIIRTKYATGTASKSAVLQASHEKHLLLQEAIELRAAIERDKSQIKRFVNLPTMTSLTLAESPSLESAPANISKVFRAMLAELDSQPVMRQLSAKEKQKNYQTQLAEKDRYPSFTASARYNSVWMNDEQRWMVGVGFNIPLDFGKRTRRESALKAEAMALRYEQQDVRVQLREQLEQAKSLWQQAVDVNQLYQSELLPLAEENLVTARDEYQSGSNDFLSLLTAERQTLNTQRKAEQAQRDIHIQLAGLIAAAGWVHLPPFTHQTLPNGDKTLSNFEGSRHE